MINKYIDTLLELANDNITVAEEEFKRPHGDVVTISACHAANNAIREYLTAIIAYNYSLEYPMDDLVTYSLNKITEWNIDLLQEFAGRIEPQLASMDLSHVQCAGIKKENPSEVYCLKPNEVLECARTARQIGQIVNEYIKNNKQPRDNTKLRAVMRVPVI